MTLYRNVIDTSLLYKLQSETGGLPSLRDISKNILGKTLQVTHDSVEDARVALEAAVYFVSNANANGVIEVERSVAVVKDVDAIDESASLFVHRIPENLTEESLTQMFVATTFVCPVKVPQIQRDPGRGGDTGKVVVTFASAAHAELALVSVPGPQRPDKAGRSQKRVYLKSGGYIYVRKF